MEEKIYKSMVRDIDDHMYEIDQLYMSMKDRLDDSYRKINRSMCDTMTRHDIKDNDRSDDERKKKYIYDMIYTGMMKIKATIDTLDICMKSYIEGMYIDSTTKHTPTMGDTIEQCRPIPSGIHRILSICEEGSYMKADSGQPNKRVEPTAYVLSLDDTNDINVHRMVHKSDYTKGSKLIYKDHTGIIDSVGIRGEIVSCMTESSMGITFNRV